jgi:phosphopantothenoylcysteine decarboxylase / phosphopantothenate---cysteine ligase
MSTGHTKVTVGVCGGIAAYKSVELVRLLQDAGYDPHVVMTKAAEEFVRPLTFAAISGHRVITSLWGEDAGVVSEGGESSIEHIHEAQTTKLLIVAPATADTLAKFAHGLADDFLSTMFLATTAPVIVAPAMNVNMWEHPATRANVETLRARGVKVIEPGSGYLACGMVGGGRLAEPAAIVMAVTEKLAGASITGPGPAQSDNHPGVAQNLDFSGETLLVTAGGTREAIDPVRFIGNRSSGRMGYAVAEAARRRGARVILISAPTNLPGPAGVEIVPVVTADEMRDAMMDRLREATIVVMAAAVSDFRVRSVAAQKIKRESARPVLLELEATEDILSEVVERRVAGTIVVGFAAETEDALANGRAKLARKGVDAVVVNNVSLEGIGFDAEQNAGSFLTRSGAVELPVMSKVMMADRILDEVAKLRG